MPLPALLPLLAGILPLLLAAPAGAASALRLAYPDSFSTVPAATYDLEGDRIGGARVVVERLPEGTVRLTTEIGFEEGPRTLVTAALEPIENGRRLRPLWQESRSYDAAGAPLGLLRVDHQRGLASCVAGPDLDWSRAQQIALPDAERVANLTLSLLFLPLAQAQAGEIEFQMFVCRGGPRVLDFRAHVARRDRDADGRDWVEIRFGPDLGALGLLLTPLLPQLSVWLAPEAAQPWLAHRMPLYSQGPEVLVVRDGVAPDRLFSEP